MLDCCGLLSLLLMEHDISPYITAGIWLSGIIFFLLLLVEVGRILYNIFIRPFRRYGKLTLQDLRNRRKFKTNRKTLLMKITEVCIWVSGAFFTFFMLSGIAMSIYYNFLLNKPFKHIYLQMLNVDNISRIFEKVESVKDLRVDDLQLKLPMRASNENHPVQDMVVFQKALEKAQEVLNVGFERQAKQPAPAEITEPTEATKEKRKKKKKKHSSPEHSR